MQRRDELKLIQERVPITEVLAGLAEEAAELAQAALKMRRALDGRNPTPVSERRALVQLHEEIADVSLYMDALGDALDLAIISRICVAKMKRWAGRLENEGGMNNGRTQERE